MKINFKSDFDFILHLMSCSTDGDKQSEVGWPEYDWTAKFYTDSQDNAFIASCIGGECLNCFNDNGNIHVVVNSHRLGKGQLKVEFYAAIPNSLYPDGTKDLVTPQSLDVELVRGRGDCGTIADVEVMLSFIKGDKGDAFTYEDFTAEQIAELQRPATEAAESVSKLEEEVSQAEALRASAEQTREANEQSRISAENGRVSGENERKANETARQSNEATRIANENERQQNEESRVSAEAARAEEFAGWEAQIDTKADRSELSNVLAEEPLTPGNFPDIDTYTREQLTRGLFRDLWLATLAMFPRMPTYGQDVAATLPDGSQYGLNGLVFGYEVATKVMLWSKVPDANAGLFNYDYTMPADVPTLFPTYMYGTPDLNHAWRACEWVRALTVYSAAGLTIRPTKAINLFAVCKKLEKIYGVVDFIYIHQSDRCVNAFGMCYKLVDIQLAGLHTDVVIRDSPLLSQESVEYMVEQSTNTAAITITVHPQVYAKLTDETNTEWHAILARAAEKNINFATV